MAAEYYAVFNKENYPSDNRAVVVGSAKAGCEVLEQGLKSARFVKLKSEAGTEAQAREILRELYPGSVTDKIAIIPAANWTEG